MKHFSELVIYWYKLNKRDLPWRKTKDPFKIWLAEIIMQQTRVKQGLDYYISITNRFKDINSLAEASEEEVLKLWQGLGYYSRARNLHYASRQIVDDMQGEFPSDYFKLLKIKGIGEYSAAAIASIAFDQPYPVLDGNVYRVMSRYSMISDPVNSTTGKKKIKNLLNKLIDPGQPGIFNQALMELGALICTPKNPDCKKCPLITDCQSFNQNKTANFPVKAIKDIPTDRFLHYFIPLILDDNIWYTIIKKRMAGDIWAGLYEFPLLESDQLLSEDELRLYKQIPCIPTAEIINSIYFSVPIHHQLTHRNIHARFWIVEVKYFDLLSVNKDFTMIQLKSLLNYPVSRLIDRFLSSTLIFNIITQYVKIN